MSDKCTDEQPHTDTQDSISAYERLCREIAERKQIEETLNVLNTEFRNFVHTVSHDLRAPLRKISSFGLLLKESLDASLKQEDQENLELVINGAKRMTRMIEDILAYSRANATALTTETVDLNDILEQLRQSELAALLEESGAAVEIPAPLPDVDADTLLVRQLLCNLIVGAIERRRQDVPPRILITAAAVAGDQVRIEVQDNGRSIDLRDGCDIFRMFARLYKDQNEEEAGTRLAVCRKIVSRHGGRIGIKSEAAAGSTFWLTLPTAKGSQQQEKPPLHTQSGFGADTASDETRS